MKKLLPFLGFAIMMSACNTSLDKNATSSAAPQQQVSADTTGLASYNAWKAQNELAQLQTAQPVQQSTASAPKTKTIVKRVPVYVAPKSSSQSSSSSSNSTVQNDSGSGSGTMNNESSETAKVEKKTGWSKAAKGAVIGGVAGAVGGAVINKKNRVVGAVIGGVVGAAGGYGIGRTMDKKDGRIDYSLIQK